MRFTLFLLFCAFLCACNNDKLPVYGPRTVKPGTTDSIDYTLPAFTFTDQDNQTVNTATVQNKIYVADFFFTSCPSICPKMMAEMLKVEEKYKNNPDVMILSYSIDPERDTVAKLKAYEKKLDIAGSNWRFLTGNKDSIYHLADKYLVSAAEDPDAPGGHIHSGNFILVDKHQRLRGYYDGTKDDGVEKLLADMEILLKEK